MNAYDDDFMSRPNIGQPLVELLAMTIEPKPQLHMGYQLASLC